MSDDPMRTITDDLLLSELTVGEFKRLLAETLATVAVSSGREPSAPDETPAVETIEPVRRMSLDEFLSDA